MHNLGNPNRRARLGDHRYCYPQVVAMTPDAANDMRSTRRTASAISGRDTDPVVSAADETSPAAEARRGASGARGE